MSPGVVPARRVPTQKADLDMFQAHLARTALFSEALKDQRCARTGHFNGDLRGTLEPLQHLMNAWSTEILFALHINGPQRFNDLLRNLEPISPRVLTDKLRHLQDHGSVARRHADDHSTYGLTEHGRQTTRLLHPVLYYLRNRDEATTSALTVTTDA